jgi:hypothetical protein
MKARYVALLLVTAGCFFGGAAQAQVSEIESRVLARRLADEGATLFESGQYEQARELFHRANSLFPAPALELWEARSLNKLGRLVEAEERYASVKRYRVRPEDSEVVRAAVAEATAEVDKLRKRIPTITIQVRGAAPTDPSLVVQMAGKPLNPAMIGLPIPTDPSAPTVVLLRQDVEVTRETVVLREGDHRILELEASHPTAGSAQAAAVSPSRDRREYSGASTYPDSRPWYRRRSTGWVVTGVGAASLAVGVTTGILAVGKRNYLSQHCTNQACPESLSDDLDSFRAYRTVSTIGYVVGAVGLGAGITILALSSRPSSVVSNVSLHLGTNAAAVRVHF